MTAINLVYMLSHSNGANLSERTRSLMVLRTRSFPVQDSDYLVRGISDGDSDLLAALMLSAYEGTVDDQGETLEQSKAEAAQTIAGKYGPLEKSASFIVCHDGNAICAAVVTHYQSTGPLLAYLMTDPAFQGQGLGTMLLKKAISALKEEGIEKLHLYVTDANLPAVSLYEKLGFERVPAGASRNQQI